MDDEPKSAAELKEIRLKRKRDPGSRGHQGDGRDRGCGCRDPKADREAARAPSGERKRPTAKTRRNRTVKAKARAKTAKRG